MKCEDLISAIKNTATVQYSLYGRERRETNLVMAKMLDKLAESREVVTMIAGQLDEGNKYVKGDLLIHLSGDEYTCRSIGDDLVGRGSHPRAALQNFMIATWWRRQDAEKAARPKKKGWFQ